MTTPDALRSLELQPLRDEHRAEVLAFELENRTYFARFVSDRGDEYFERFPERQRALLAEQEAGICAFHVLVDAQGRVVGRFNLYDLADSAAEVGYRVAEQVAGRGVATSALRELCRVARTRHGLHRLTAVTSETNVASQRVLQRTGFVAVGPAEVAGRQGTRFELVLGREVTPSG